MMGLLLVASWRFEDGSSTFVQASPRTADTPVLVDEDGDEHAYLVVENMPKKVPARPPAVPLSARRPAPGGYGFFVRETVDEDYEASPDSPRGRRPKRPAPKKKAATPGPPKKTRVPNVSGTEKAPLQGPESVSMCAVFFVCAGASDQGDAVPEDAEQDDGIFPNQFRCWHGLLMSWGISRLFVIAHLRSLPAPHMTVNSEVEMSLRQLLTTAHRLPRLQDCG
ncbi:unnamed protein product [Symbiodinium natans]|uniref:Uncharacterized protein n=1 Tax=Symbiodinium natans TaxID=878477 RepID=A0A812HQN5_9DINO|nr:unnamed protein product [Symbiodinium natans]